MITLRKLQASDLEQRVEWMNNPSIYTTMHFVPPISLDTTREWFEKNQKVNTRIDVAFDDEEGNLVAMGGLTAIDFSVRKAEFYVFVNPKMQKRGFGTQATYLLCKYGFEILQLHKIYLYTNGTNIGARKTYEKVGFTLEGTMRDERIAGEKYEDRLYYGLLAGELDKERFPLQMSGSNFMRVDSVGVDGMNLKVVRDDLYPDSGGGIKSRKTISYERFLRDGGYNAVVTCGGIQSNHNRAVAIMAARNGWKCHLCVQGTQERFDAEKGNALLCRLAGAECEVIDPKDTAASMDRAMEQLKAEGYKPYYIHGGGHDLPGGTSFVEAVQDLKRQCDEMGYKPDYIFHASGTGSTQAGIVVGCDLVGWSDVKVVGISVARQYERGKQVIADFANMLAGHYGLKKDYADEILFNTDYLFGGYEEYTPEMKSYLDEVMARTGLMFDTTYSGKGFYGMMQEIKKQGLQNKNIIFWHTGGLMNLMK